MLFIFYSWWNFTRNKLLNINFFIKYHSFLKEKIVKIGFKMLLLNK